MEPARLMMLLLVLLYMEGSGSCCCGNLSDLQSSLLQQPVNRL